MAWEHKYVDPSSGNDSNSGDSDAEAYKTVQAAIDGCDGTEGNQINLKSSAADVLTALPSGTGPISWASYSPTNGQNNPLIISGYTSTHGDGGIGEIDGNDAVANIFASSSTPQHFFLKDLKLHSCTSYMAYFAAYWGIFRCEITAVGASGGASWDPGSIGVVYGCHVHTDGNASPTDAIKMGYYSYVAHNYVHDVTGDGIYLDGNMAICTNNLVHTTGDHGINSNSNEMHFITNNTVVGTDAPSDIGLDLNASDIVIAVGNILKDWATGINGDSGGIVMLHGYNLLNSNAAAESFSGQVVHDLGNDPTDDPGFTDADGGDFSVGVNAKAKSYPTTFKGSSTNTYIDSGAAQRQEAGGGGGTIRRHPKVLGGA